MTGNATPRRQPGARQDQSATYCSRLVAAIVPRPDLAIDYVVLAAMLHCPDLAAPHVARLHPGDWTTELHRIVARIALWHLRTIGRVDHRQLAGVLLDAGMVRPGSFALEVATLARVAELIHTGGIVANAVAVMTGRSGLAV